MEHPLIDKVARRRSAVAILISLLSLWISIEGIDSVRANFKGLALTSFVTAPMVLLYIGTIVVLWRIPKLIQRLKNRQFVQGPAGKPE